MLEPQIKRFDPRLFAMLQESFQSLPGNAAAGRALQSTLPLLVAGCALSENMMFEDGRMALGKGTVLNEALIERLRNVNAINRIREPITATRPAVEETHGPPTAETGSKVKAFKAVLEWHKNGDALTTAAEPASIQSYSWKRRINIASPDSHESTMTQKLFRDNSVAVHPLSGRCRFKARALEKQPRPGRLWLRR